MRTVLVTGMSGTGKSTVLIELARRGMQVVDTDDEGWSEEVLTPDGTAWHQVWREDRISGLLDSAGSGPLVVSGCVSNQGRFYDRFDAVVLLSAPLEVLAGRLASRNDNPFGKSPEDMRRIMADIEVVEPLLRQTSTLEIDGRLPVTVIADRIQSLTRRAGIPSVSGNAIGIDGYRGGWVAANLTDSAVDWSTARIPEVGSLLGPDVVAAIDMPIGLLAAGERKCDALARQSLPGASSRVFTTPPRGVLELGPSAPNSDAQIVSRRLMGKGVSRQALHLAPRILALDAFLAATPDHRVVEVHPEVSFAEMSGRVLPRKKSPEGVAARLDALRAWLPESTTSSPADPPTCRSTTHSTRSPPCGRP